MSSDRRPVTGQLVLLCGTSFAGKSTVAESVRAELAATVVSLDEINERRGLRGGEGIAVEEWQRTHAIARGEVRTALSSGATVVVDDSSSQRFLRDGWRDLSDDVGAAFVLVYVAIESEERAARLRCNRERLARNDILDTVMDSHLDSFEFPQDDEAPITVHSTDDLARTLAPRLRPMP